MIGRFLVKALFSILILPVAVTAQNETSPQIHKNSILVFRDTSPYEWEYDNIPGVGGGLSRESYCYRRSAGLIYP